jgi:hypothetical protein
MASNFVPAILTRLVTDLSPRGIGFNPRLFHVEFVVEIFALRQAFLRVPPLFFILISLPAFHTYYFSIQQRYVTSVIDSAVKNTNREVPPYNIFNVNDKNLASIRGKSTAQHRKYTLFHVL